ncbi:t-SNARE [Meredithblackwellia eburnea MCA 4105]
MAATAGPGPYTRSRTNLFLSYRDSAVRSTSSSFYTSSSKRNSLGLGGKKGAYAPFEDDADESRGLMEEGDLEMGMGGSSGSRRGAATLPPKWVDIADRVDEIVDKVKPKIAHLDKLHAKHILPGFKDRSAEEREIENLASEITRDFRSTQKYIRQIAEMSKLLLTSGGASESKRVDLIMAANVQTALATKVQELSGVFRKKQTAYLRQLKGHEKSGDSKDPLVSLAADEQYSQSFLQNSQSQSQTQSQTYASQATIDIQQRDQEISKIAQSITDLADMFKDLSSLVIDQGTLLDRVDYNVEQMGVEVKGAVEELKAATRHQKRSGKCQIIFLLVLLIIGAIVVLVYRPRGARPTALIAAPPSSAPPRTPTEEGVVGINRAGGDTSEAVRTDVEPRDEVAVERMGDRFTGGKWGNVLARRNKGETSGAVERSDIVGIGERESQRQRERGRQRQRWARWQ